MVSIDIPGRTYIQSRNRKSIIFLCVMFSLLLSTYIFFDNVYVSSSEPGRRPSDDITTTKTTTEEEPRETVEQEKPDLDLPTKIVIAVIIGVPSAAVGFFARKLRIRTRFSILYLFWPSLFWPPYGKRSPGRRRAPEDEFSEFPDKEGRKEIIEQEKPEGAIKRCCTTASSATGTGMMAQVNFLRNYREKVVKKSAKGQRSLSIAEKIYYPMSTPIAKLNVEYEKFRLFTRTFWTGPIVSLLLCGMLLFNSGRKEFIRLQKIDSKLILKIFTMGIASSIFAISWILWNCYLIISLFHSGPLANIWQPAAGMLIGILSLLILRYFYRDLPILSDDTKLI